MIIPGWKLPLLVICSVLFLLNEALWQWRWWRLDNTGVGVTPCSGNQILIRNDSKATICQPCPICGEGMILSPPCGSILTYDTVIECKPPLTKALMASKRKKPEHKHFHSFTRNRNAHYGKSKDDGSSGSKTIKWTAWPSLDISDISDEEELEDSNLSEIADLNSFLSPSQDIKGISTVSPPTKASLSNAFQRWRQRRLDVPRPIARPPVVVNTRSKQPIPEQMNKGSYNFTTSSQNISINCVLGGFLGTSLACLLSGAALLWLLLSLQKRRGWYMRWHGTELPESEVEELPYFNEKADYTNTTSSSYAATSVNLKQLNLSELPPDLEHLLVKTLDVRRRGERHYGWQKVGAAFKISKDDLEYLKIEYRRDNGSPTSTLLSILGTKGKTVSDLENVLRSPKGKLPNVASRIRRYIKEANKFQ